MPVNPAARDPEVTAVILAGGKGRRMGGEDKGLLELNGRLLIDYIIDALRPQSGHIIINANRNLDRYRASGYPVVADMLGDHFGPLAGMATGMQAATTPLLLVVPCDSPFIPAQLCSMLRIELEKKGADISVAYDGTRIQPVCSMLRCKLLPDLLSYLNAGRRRVDTWVEQQRLALVDFSAVPDSFLNMNNPSTRQIIERKLAGQT
jgi:molybdopterin-guanine dinucleotide biosynthesis protein A